MYFDASISPNEAPLRLYQRAWFASDAGSRLPRSKQYVAASRNRSRHVSSLPMRLMAAAFGSNAQTSAAHPAVAVSKSVSASMKMMPVVAAPASAFGRRSAASGGRGGEE